jgi:mono/diheme cytochrome c family protein
MLMTRPSQRLAGPRSALALIVLAVLAGWPLMQAAPQSTPQTPPVTPPQTQPETKPATTPAQGQAPATQPAPATAPAHEAPKPAAPAQQPAAREPAAHEPEGHGEAHGAQSEEAAKIAAIETGPFARAPLHVPLEITEPARLVAPGEDAMERMAKAEPSRFSKSGDHWVDARGEYAWDDDEEIYWQNVPADVLTRGRQDFVQFCSSCHGLEGDGNGRSARSLRPPPRSFKQSTFKFTKVEAKYLPSDEALIALVRHGLDGTPMLRWEVSETRLHDIVQYIKSLSPEDTGWRDTTAEIGDVVETGPDPWAGKEQDAVAAGEAAYHKNQCYQCHPGYLTAAKINEVRGTKDTYPEDLTYSKLKRDSAFDVQGYHVAIPAPDFTWDTIRYGRDVKEVYQTIAAGIGGAGMPTWKGGMDDKDIWAIAHYVRHLIDTWKDKPGRAAFMASLRKGS